MKITRLSSIELMIIGEVLSRYDRDDWYKAHNLIYELSEIEFDINEYIGKTVNVREFVDKLIEKLGDKICKTYISQ